MSERSKIYFASDFHLGAPGSLSSPEREKKIITWLNDIQTDAKEIYLVGDVFDFWYEWKHAVPRGYVRILGKLAEICDKGIPIHFFTGNHDMWTFGYLEKEIGLIVHRNPLEITLQGKNCFIGHGDGLGQGDKGYKFLKKLFISPICQWLFSRLHPNLSFSLANHFSTKSRISNFEKGKKKFKGEEKEWLVHYARSILLKKPMDLFVFGHRHLPLKIQLNEQSQYANLGEWIKYYSYGVLENGHFEIKFYKSKFSKPVNEQ